MPSFRVLMPFLVLLAAVAAGCGTPAGGLPPLPEGQRPAFLPGTGPGAAADISGIRRKWLDLPYAALSPAQKLDIFLPETGDGPFPVILSVHGGAFMAGDKRGEVRAVLPALKRGYAVAAINYRLSGEAKFPANIQDVKAAVRFLRANAATYRLDPARFAAWGGSAGGNLCALLGTSGGVAELEDFALGNPGQSSRVQAVVDWFGPTNFLLMDEQHRESGMLAKNPRIQKHGTADSPESRVLGGKLSAVPERVKAANPETYITPDDPPFFIQHGEEDPIVPVRQSADFAAALAKTLGREKVVFELLPGAGHGGAAFEAPANIEKILDFLDRRLGKMFTAE